MLTDFSVTTAALLCYVENLRRVTEIVVAFLIIKVGIKYVVNLTLNLKLKGSFSCLYCEKVFGTLTCFRSSIFFCLTGIGS